MGDHNGSVVSYKSSVRSHLSNRLTDSSHQNFDESAEQIDPPYTFISNLAVAQNVYGRNMRSSCSSRSGSRSPYRHQQRPLTSTSSISSSRFGSGAGGRRSHTPSTNRPNTVGTTSSNSLSSLASPKHRGKTVHSSSSSLSSPKKSPTSGSVTTEKTTSSKPPDPQRLSYLSKPRKAREKFTSNGIAKTSWDWIEYQGSQTPAAQYDTDKSFHHLEQRNGGKFNKSNPKSDLEWKIYYAKSLPSPGQYDLKPKKVSGGSFSTAKPKTDIEWQIYNAKQMPGPGLYSVDAAIEKPSGGRFNTSKPKSDLDWTIYRAKNLPGPGEYKPSEKKTSGGSFSTAKPKTDIEWQIYNAQQLPSGENYETDKAHKNIERPSGGKFNMSKPKSEIDWKIYSAKSVPGPGDYSVPSPLKIGSPNRAAPASPDRMDSSGKFAPFL